jgi:SAM-dependent methyltransferase
MTAMQHLAAIRAHYAASDIADRLLAAIRAALGTDVLVTPEVLAPLDHYHRRGLAATRELVARIAPEASHAVLDIGCGVGGPARWIAARYGCRVVGLDLIADYCGAANALNAATGLADRVAIVEGDAAALPFLDGAFDRAVSHSVLMNIADLPAALREARRVLVPGGLFGVSVICSGPGGPAHLPAPYATAPEASHLVSPGAMCDALLGSGFDIVEARDLTAAAVVQQRETLARLGSSAPMPPLGWHVIIGEDRAREAQANAARSFVEGRLTEFEFVLRRR